MLLAEFNMSRLLFLLIRSLQILRSSAYSFAVLCSPLWLMFVPQYCWFSHYVTKTQTTNLSFLLRFYFHGVLEQLKTNFQTNFRLKRVLGFVMEYAWISKLLRDGAFTYMTAERAVVAKLGNRCFRFVFSLPLEDLPLQKRNELKKTAKI